MRRLLTVAFLAVLVSTSAACGDTADDATTGAAPSTATSSAASPTADVKANTTTVCGKAEKIISEENVKAVGEQIGKVIAAKQTKNKAAQTAAEASVKTQADALAKQLTDLKTEAADPKLQAALEKAAAGVVLLGSPDYLAKINTIDDLTKMGTDLNAAGADLEAICK